MLNGEYIRCPPISGSTISSLSKLRTLNKYIDREVFEWNLRVRFTYLVNVLAYGQQDL